MAARLERPGKGFVGDQPELYLREEALSEGSAYERLLGDAMVGDGAFFTSQDAVEAAWAVIDPVLVEHPVALPYWRGSWGPTAADALIAAEGDDPRLAVAVRAVFHVDLEDALEQPRPTDA
jgi:glucose-6-phosphate 1-dehydrogenase